MTKRIQRVNQLIKKELSKIILREVDFPRGALVTLTRTEASADLRHAMVYISVMPETMAKEVIQILDSHIYDIQQQFNKRLNMKLVPKIDFEIEKETVEADRIEKILEKIKGENE